MKPMAVLYMKKCLIYIYLPLANSTDWLTKGDKYISNISSFTKLP
jgi:hypothetical protein